MIIGLSAYLDRITFRSLLITVSFVLQFEPIYTPGMEHFVHHLVILRCVGKHPELDMATAECLSDWPKGWPSCPERVIVWATGGGVSVIAVY